MKKINLILVLFLILPMISTIQVDMNEEFKQGETLIAQFSGNFIKPILEDNIYFYRGYVQVPFEFNVIKIEQNYFVYTPSLGKQAGNYSIVVKNSEYDIVGGQTSTEDIIKEFVLLSDYADFSTTPGAIKADSSFSLEVENLKGIELEIYIDKSPTEEVQESFFSSLFGGNENKTLSGESFILKAGETKQINLNSENIPAKTLTKIGLKTQDFTQWIFVYLENPIYEINESEYIEINETNQTENNQTEFIELENGTIISQRKTCEELNGTICKVGKEVCDKTTIEASNTDSCCPGTCNEKEKSSTGKIIGFSIVGILIILYIWFYFKKYKKTKRNVNLLALAEGKDKRQLEKIQRRVRRKIR